MSVPNRIQRLLKSLLTESPDRPMANRSKKDVDVEKLASSGFDVDALMHTNWSAEDAVTFAIDTRYHVVMWMANNADERAYQHADFDDFFTGGYRDANVSKGVVGMEWKQYRTVAQWHKDFFSSGERANSKMMLGRLWRKSGFVSFWNKKDDVMREWKLILDFVTNMELNPKKCAYEFIDRVDIELYDEVTGKTDDKHKDIDSEVLRQMHTSAELKKAILGTDTGKKKSAMDGYYTHVGDGIIKSGSLMTEDPDGIDAHGVVLKHTDYDANTFVYYAQHELLFMGKSGELSEKNSYVYHYTLVDLFGMIGSIFKDESWYEYDEETEDYSEEPLPIETVDQFNQHCELMGYDIYWDEAVGWIRWGKRNIQIYGDTNKAIDYMIDQAGTDHKNTPKYREKYSSIGVMGRYWEDSEVIAFWLMKRDIGRLLARGGLVGLFDYLGLDTENVRLATADDADGLIRVRDALEAAGEKPKMTRDQERELMMKQHLDPESKRKLNQDADAIDKYGGILPAQFHAWSRTSDGVIKLGDLLTESPDGVFDENGEHQRHEWYDGDAHAFFAFPSCCFIKRRDIHNHIWNALRQCYREQSLDPILKPVNGAYVGIGFDVTREKLLELLKPSGEIGKLIQNDLDDEYDDYRSEIPGVLAGRVWGDSKLISFWNKQSDVLKNWANVESMFKKFFGNLTDFMVDWIERDADARSGTPPRPLTPASEVGLRTSKDNKSTDKSVTVMSKILQQPEVLDKVDDKILKKIQQKLHVLDPQAKAQVMKAVGSITPHKAVLIADKLGMTVAEFNHIMHVNESSSKLKSLMPDH